MDVRRNTDADVGLLRIYNSDKCELDTTTCKIRSFSCNIDKTIEFSFEHMNVPIDSSNHGGCGFYNFLLPRDYRLTDLHIVDPFDKPEQSIEKRKHFSYDVYWDAKAQLQMIQMELQSRRGSFSFILSGEAKPVDDDENFIESIEQEVSLDRQIKGFFFDEKIKRAFWKDLVKSLICAPNINGVGIDIRELLRLRNK